MPGPVSDSYDPEFGSGTAAAEVEAAVRELRDWLTQVIGSEQLMNIVELVHWHNQVPLHGPLYLTERQLRILRFAVDRGLESL